MALPGAEFGPVLAPVAEADFFGGVIGPQRIANGQRGSYDQTAIGGLGPTSFWIMVSLVKRGRSGLNGDVATPQSYRTSKGYSVESHTRLSSYRHRFYFVVNFGLNFVS
jgi:hypothetical protein